jgi:hypothetical protein
MIRLVKAVHRALKRRRHFRAGEARLAGIAPDIEKRVGGPVCFRPGRGGGHDFVYFVERGGGCAGVLRIANPAHVPEGTPFEARLSGPRLRLTPNERVAREGRFCEAGWRRALTPRPLWRSPEGDALLVGHLAGPRLSDCVRQGRIALWDAIDRTAERAGVFHAVVGEAHMDLSLFNVYADDRLDVLTFVDFELAADPALPASEARLFDTLNLVEMAYKGMSSEERRAAPVRLARLFSEFVPDDLKGQPVARLAAKLPRILADPVFRDVLSRHFVV